MTARITCLVLFCRRSRGDRKNDPLPADLSGYEWICAEHWRAVPAKRRRVYRRAKRNEALALQRDAAAYEKLLAYVASDVWKLAGDHPLITARVAAAFRAADAMSRAQRLWRACRAHAIEAAMGIAS